MTVLFALVLAASVALVVGQVVDGRLVSISGIFTARWALLIVLYLASPIPYNGVSHETWVLVIGSVLAFLVSYSIVIRPGTSPWPVLTPQPSAISPAQQESPEILALRRLERLLLIVGGSLFAVYAANLAVRFGLLAAYTEPQALRLAISRGQVPLGFHFLYFFELIPVVIAVRRRMSGVSWRSWSIDYATVGFVLLALLSTTARTNALKALIWAVIAIVMLSPPRRRPARRALLVSATVAAGIALFVLIDSLRGRSLENLPIRSARDQIPSWFEPFAAPTHYLTAPLPALDALVAEGTSYQLGARSLNPLAKAWGVLNPTYEAPTHIAEFRDTPYRFNVYTQLDVLFLDFGVVGAVLASAVLGLAAGVAMKAWKQAPGSPARFLLVTWFALIANASTGAAAFGKLSYVLQLGLIGLLAHWTRRARRRSSRADSADVERPLRVVSRHAEP